MGVIDTDGKILAATFREPGDFREAAANFTGSPAESQEIQGHQFFKVYDDQQLEYIIVVQGSSENAYTIGKIAAFQIQNLQIAYKERYDKDNFIKNLLLDNLLLVDIYNRSQKLRIETDVRRVAIVAESVNDKENNSLEAVKMLFSGRTNDFITAVDEDNIIIIREMGQNEGYDEVAKAAHQIYELFEQKGFRNLHVSYGTIVKEIKLPIPLCKMFIKEIFDGKSPDDFDEETITTINKFFENSLNVSETSRQLYIHRNTLVYRLDKLQKTTNLDLRVFEDAITFKIALMVVKYMKYMEDFDF